MGFLTGSSSRTLNQVSNKDLVSVFIPSSPMPITGYTIFVAAEEIVSLDLTVDEALRTIISGGVLLPTKEQATISPEAKRLLGQQENLVATGKEPDAECPQDIN